jgi:hypothetical protein
VRRASAPSTWSNPWNFWAKCVGPKVDTRAVFAAGPSNTQGYQSFAEVINYLIELLFGRDPILRANKRLTRAIVFYMYWNCDVGLNDDAETE